MRAKVERRDVEKERYWQEKIRAGAKSGLSIREFCHREGLQEGQFHSWRRELWRWEQEGKKKRVKKTIFLLTFNDLRIIWNKMQAQCPQMGEIMQDAPHLKFRMFRGLGEKLATLLNQQGFLLDR